MLQLASRAIWETYGQKIVDYDAKINQMHRDAKRIAAENWQRDLERELQAKRGEA